MIKSILLNRKVIVFFTIPIFFIGCGEGGERDITPEDIAFIEQFTNGQGRDNQVSEWDCLDEVGIIFSFAICLDRTGVSTDLGAFIWEQEGPRRIEMEGAVDREIKDIEGIVSNGSGTLLFDQDIEGDFFNDIDTSCSLDSAPNDTI